MLAVGVLLKIVRAADLRDNRLDAPEVIAQLGSVVSDARLQLGSLNVAGNALGANGASSLCAELPKGITHLDLSWNIFGNERSFSGAAPKFNEVTQKWEGRRDIGAKAMASVAPSARASAPP